MHLRTSSLSPAAEPLPVWMRDAGVVVVVVVLLFATFAWGGFPSISDPRGDNDSMLRLVEVRDLLNGQNWYDTMQYRMGLPGGFPMHWSRLIDAPIAGLILLASAIGASTPLAEQIAITVWPMILMAWALFALMQLARTLDGEAAILPATVLGVAALYFTGVFLPGAIDHHSAQLALTVTMLLLMVKAGERPPLAGFAGLCAAAMLAIGMETAPYVAVAGAGMAIAFLFGGRKAAKAASFFGLGFAGGTLIAVLATVGPRNWFIPACDALSLIQLSVALTGGLGLAGIALLDATSRTMVRRGASLAALGIAVLLLARLGFPQCLDDPYAAAPPLMKTLLMNAIAEVQSIVDIARAQPLELLIYYLTPALSLATLGVLLAREGFKRARLFYGGFLLAAYCVSCWQVRGAVFAVPMATTGLAIFLARVRVDAERRGDLASNLKLLGTWLVSINILWSVLANALGAGEEASASESRHACTAVAGYAKLAALPEGRVLAVSDLGAAILRNTGHSVLSGPYHRNIEGNLAMYDGMLGNDTKALTTVRRLGIGYIAICLGNGENRIFADRAPDGLMARLLAEDAPDWLRLEAATRNDSIRVYRVAPANP